MRLNVLDQKCWLLSFFVLKIAETGVFGIFELFWVQILPNSNILISFHHRLVKFEGQIGLNSNLTSKFEAKFESKTRKFCSNSEF